MTTQLHPHKTIRIESPNGSGLNTRVIDVKSGQEISVSRVELTIDVHEVNCAKLFVPLPIADGVIANHDLTVFTLDPSLLASAFECQGRRYRLTPDEPGNDGIPPAGA